MKMRGTEKQSVKRSKASEAAFVKEPKASNDDAAYAVGADSPGLSHVETPEPDPTPRKRPGALMRAHSSFRAVVVDVPGFSIAVAGMAFCLLVKESQKMPGFQSVSMGETDRWIPAPIALIPLALLVLVYWANPRFRLCRNPLSGLLVGALTSFAALPLSGMLIVDLSPTVEFLIRCVSRCCELLLVVCWAEVLLQMRARQVAAIVGAAMVAVGAMDAVLSLLKPDFVVMCTAFMAPLSMGMLYWFKDYNHFLRESRRLTVGGALPIDESLRIGTGKSPASFVLALSVPFLCYPFVLGCIHSTWLPLQSVAATALHVQLGYALGAIAAGFLFIYLAMVFWGRRKIELYNLIALPFLMLALYLTAKSQDSYLFMYVFLQSFVEKVAMSLLFLAPFLIATRCSPMIVWVVSLLLFESGKLLASALLPVLSVAVYSNCTIVAAIVLAVSSIAVVGIDSGPGFAAAGIGGSPCDGESRYSLDAAENDISDFSAGNETKLNGVRGVQATTGMDAASHAGTAGPSVEGGSACSQSSVLGAAPEIILEETAVERIARDYRLTNREEEVLQLLATGMTAKSIAEELIISPGTAKSHLRNIYSKLGVHSQSELILLVHDNE